MHGQATRWRGSVSEPYQAMTSANDFRSAETVQGGKQAGKTITAYKVLLQLGLAKRCSRAESCRQGDISSIAISIT
jgi:hypothetical protein